jgi:hypothetical protein
MSSGDVVACVRGGPRGAALFREKGRIFFNERYLFPAIWLSVRVVLALSRGSFGLLDVNLMVIICWICPSHPFYIGIDLSIHEKIEDTDLTNLYEVSIYEIRGNVAIQVKQCI